mmetsp:Transcript_41133/g.103678  ORF Transcript_41133/g.103678 Transcript_41133/m.103678 type:complete len:246 (-) Transcript_41133:43-780(-)
MRLGLLPLLGRILILELLPFSAVRGLISMPCRFLISAALGLFFLPLRTPLGTSLPSRRFLPLLAGVFLLLVGGLSLFRCGISLLLRAFRLFALLALLPVRRLDLCHLYALILLLLLLLRGATLSRCGVLMSVLLLPLDIWFAALLLAFCLLGDFRFVFALLGAIPSLMLERRFLLATLAFLLLVGRRSQFHVRFAFFLLRGVFLRFVVGSSSVCSIGVIRGVSTFRLHAFSKAMVFRCVCCSDFE